MSDEIELLDGAVRFSRERMTWHVAYRGDDPVVAGIPARLVTETAPSGAIYLRLATPIEDELLDKLIEAGFWTP